MQPSSGRGNTLTNPTSMSCLDGRVPYKIGGDEEGQPVGVIVTGVPRAGRDE
jgi:hypothetical protein